MVEKTPTDPPTEASIIRARPHVYKALLEENITNLSKLLGAGFPISEIVMYPSTTALMLAASEDKT